MEQIYLATAIAIRDLDCYSISTLDERILLQKKIFLAQKKGLLLGYGYGWYIHGPYSTDLTNAAYHIIPQGKESINGAHFIETYEKIIQDVNELETVISKKALAINKYQWYELLASIAYLKDKYPDEYLNKVKIYNPQFLDELVKEANNCYLAFNN